MSDEQEDETPVLEYVDEAIAFSNSAAVKVGNQYRPYVDVDDLRNEAWCWLNATDEDKKPIRLTRVNEALKPGGNRYSLRRHLERHLATISAREKALAVGYKPEDTYKYRRAVVAQVLPCVVQGDYEEPSTGPSDGRSSRRLNEGNNWPALRADVERAWHAVGPSFTTLEFASLDAVVLYGWTAVEAGLKYNVTPEAVRHAKDRALDKLCDFLNEPSTGEPVRMPARPRGTAEQQNPWS